jgi:CheY-like chemotaxis protein
MAVEGPSAEFQKPLREAVGAGAEGAPSGLGDATIMLYTASVMERRILVVDDDPNDAELTLRALEDLRLRDAVDLARDGQEALDYLECRGAFAGRATGDPAVVLMDVKMPRVDGIEALGRIKSNQKLKSIPVVMLTSSREERDLRRSYELGGNAYVVKPMAFEKYIEAVSGVAEFWGKLNEPPPAA